MHEATAADGSAEADQSARLDVLHVVFTFHPDPVGGTEVYVEALAEGLRRLGLACGIAAPGSRTVAQRGELSIYRWRTGPVGLAMAQGRPDPADAIAFRRILEQARPRIVHLHARTSAVSTLLLDAAHEAGARTVVTFHTPSMSCRRGTLMRGGITQCDGRLETVRCTDCILQSGGVPSLARTVLARIPDGIGAALDQRGFEGGVWTALRLRDLVAETNGDFHAFMARCDRVVAVCAWVERLLLLNGVPASKIVLSRQGLALDKSLGGDAGHRKPDGPGRLSDRRLRVVCFGRDDPAKGLDVIVAAVRPLADVELDVFAVSRDGRGSGLEHLRSMAAGHPSISIRPAVAPDQVMAEMRAADLVAVPSLGLETGPLVVLEAFAAGTPVIGSNLGGIAELVAHGVNGVLLPPGDIRAWSSALAGIAGDRGSLERLRSAISPPRTMAAVVQEMDALYRTLLGGTKP
ncbi:MAG: glycosyltransferase [Burkholderiales bacterium]|nr:glycosyltransferase [Burkholderiales bacterium]